MLKIGDIVVMNDKYYVSKKNIDKKFRVISKPREIGGTMCVWLDGFKGCYAVDGLTKVSI